MVGANAGDAITTSAYNVAIGRNALGQHTTGARNIAIGYGAMDGTAANDCPTSIDNIFMGYDAGGGTWTTNDCNYNVGIGNYVMDGAMNGAVNNTALGHLSLSAITTGYSNVALGSSAGVAITTGHRNSLLHIQ